MRNKDEVESGLKLLGTGTGDVLPVSRLLSTQGNKNLGHVTRMRGGVVRKEGLEVPSWESCEIRLKERLAFQHNVLIKDR